MASDIHRHDARPNAWGSRDSTRRRTRQRPGKHTIQVENVGVEPHHVLMFELAPAKTMEDYRAWIQRNVQGEPAATFVSAMAELSTGAAASFQPDLSAGDYVLACLITGRDEVSHATKGMVQHVRIG